MPVHAQPVEALSECQLCLWLSSNAWGICCCCPANNFPASSWPARWLLTWWARSYWPLLAGPQSTARGSYQLFLPSASIACPKWHSHCGHHQHCHCDCHFWALSQFQRSLSCAALKRKRSSPKVMLLYPGRMRRPSLRGQLWWGPCSSVRSSEAADLHSIAA